MPPYKLLKDGKEADITLVANSGSEAIQKILALTNFDNPEIIIKEISEERSIAIIPIFQGQYEDRTLDDIILWEAIKVWL